MDSTWEFVTYADFLPQLPSQPSQTLPFNKPSPRDVFEVEDHRSRVTQTPRVCSGATLGGLGGAEHGDRRAPSAVPGCLPVPHHCEPLHCSESKATPGANSEPEQPRPATPDPRFLTPQGCRFLPAELG